MIYVTLQEAKNRLPALIAAAVMGEEVVITDADHSLVKLVPAEPLQMRRSASSVRRNREMTVNQDLSREYAESFA